MNAQALNEYQMKAGRTIQSAMHWHLKLATFALALPEELFELDQTSESSKVELECGDLVWYVAGAATVLGIPLATVDEQATALQLDDWPYLPGSIAEYCGQVKKVVGHGHPTDKLQPLLVKVWNALLEQIADEGLTLESVCARNIEKLQKRYPDGFSTERSLNRSPDSVTSEQAIYDSETPMDVDE